MARTCACDRWLARAAADMGFQALPPGAQLMWFRLLAAAVVAEEKGHLRFPRSVPESVSHPLNQSVTEAEANLALLFDLGWLEADGDGRGLWLPGAKAGSARAEAARINGLRGGAPRKGETREARRERRQSEMLMVVPDAPGGTQGTEAEPKDGSSCVAAKPIPEEAVKQAVREGESWVSVGNELAAIAGMDPVRGGFNVMPAKGWMDAGASADLLREVFRKVVARPSYPKSGARSLMYFNDAVREAIAQGASGAAPAGDADPFAEIDKRWRVTVAHWDHSRGVPPSREAFRSMAA